MKNGYIYSANVDVYYPDIKFVYDTTKIEMSQYYFDCYYIRNNSKYNITFCRDAVSSGLYIYKGLAWIKHMNGFQKGFWRYDR